MGLITAGGGLTNLKLRLANANPNEVLSGKTFYSKDKTLKTGSMQNNGAWGTALNPGGSVTIPIGYHNGTGKVSANFPAMQDIIFIYDSDLSPYIGIFTFRNTESKFIKHYSNGGDYNDELIRINWDGTAYHWYWNVYANRRITYQQQDFGMGVAEPGQAILKDYDHGTMTWWKFVAL